MKTVSWASGTTQRAGPLVLEVLLSNSLVAFDVAALLLGLIGFQDDAVASSPLLLEFDRIVDLVKGDLDDPGMDLVLGRECQHLLHILTATLERRHNLDVAVHKWHGRDADGLLRKGKNDDRAVVRDQREDILPLGRLLKAVDKKQVNLVVLRMEMIIV